MAANHDEAMRCVRLAAAAMQDGDEARAARLVAKAERMYPELDAKSLAARMAGRSTGGGSGGGGLSSKKTPRASTKSAPDEDDAEESEPTRAATPEMVAAVASVRQAGSDLYKVLGVEKDAEAADLKRAYRRAVLALHPDKNCAPGSEEAFKSVARAWETLNDPARRRRYDIHGVADDEPTAAAPMRRRTRNGGAGGAFHFGNGVRVHTHGDVDLDDIFRAMFDQAHMAGGDPFEQRRARRRRRNDAAVQEVHPVVAMLWVFGILGTFSVISFFLQVVAHVLGV